MRTLPLGEACHEAYNRVVPQLVAMYPLRAEHYVIHIGPGLWQRILRELDLPRTLQDATMFGLKAVRDNTYNDTEIRLVHEVNCAAR